MIKCRLSKGDARLCHFIIHACKNQPCDNCFNYCRVIDRLREEFHAVRAVFLDGRVIRASVGGLHLHGDAHRERERETVKEREIGVDLRLGFRDKMTSDIWHCKKLQSLF